MAEEKEADVEKTITVSLKNWQSLMGLKTDNVLPNIDAVVTLLLKRKASQ